MVLARFGGTLDTMVIAGLIIALGEVVDDAIIDVENIVRRLRLNRAAAVPRPAFDVVLDASLEVRSAVVYGSLIVVLVFVPVFFLDGLAGSFFRPLALAYVLAIAASLLVALIVTPALSLMLLPQAIHEREAPVVTRLKGWYRRVLPSLIGAPRRALGIIAVSMAVALGTFSFLGEEFLPHFKEYDFLMHWVEKPGTSLDAMRRITLRASEELRAVPGVRNFGAHIGRAEVADEVVGINFTELWISLDPSAPYEATVAKLQAVVDGYPGPAARPADLSARAHQGGADRRQRDHRGPGLRSGPRSAAAQGGRGRHGDRRRQRRRRRQGAGAHARAPDRGGLRSRPGAAARGDAGHRARDGGHDGARHQGGRSLRRAEDLRRRRVGHARRAARPVRPAPAAGRTAGRRLLAVVVGRRRARHADPERDHA